MKKASRAVSLSILATVINLVAIFVGAHLSGSDEVVLSAIVYWSLLAVSIVIAWYVISRTRGTKWKDSRSMRIARDLAVAVLSLSAIEVVSLVLILVLLPMISSLL